MNETITAEEFVRIIREKGVMFLARSMGWQEFGGNIDRNIVDALYWAIKLVALPTDEPRSITGRLNGKPVMLQVVWQDEQPDPQLLAPDITK